MPSKSSTARLFIPILVPLLAVTLASVAMYTAHFIYAIRMSAEVRNGNQVTLFAYAAGLGLGAVLLPKAIACFRKGRWSWPLFGILAAALVVRLPGIDAWKYGLARDCTIAMWHGCIVCGVFILFFSAVPPGKHGVWYGCGLSVGFLWWRVMQTLTQGMEGGAEAVEWYAFFYAAQTVTTFLMAGLLILGFAKLLPPAAGIPPAIETQEARRPEHGSVLQLAGTLCLFYIANGFIGARLSPVVSNADGMWPGHILIILACPLFGLFLDRQRDGAKKLMLAASVFLMLAPSLNVLSDSPLLYSTIVSLGSLAQFAMLMTAIIVFAGMGTEPGWFGVAVLFQFSLRLVSFLIDFLWQKMAETEDGVAVFLATAAAIGFHFAARRMNGEKAPDSSPIIKPADTPDASQKYALTPRESEILALFTSGKSTEEIAQQLYISEATAKKHLRNTMLKMGVTTRNALLIKLLQEK